jgi:CBS domain containing-hemolysin-like protein
VTSAVAGALFAGGDIAITSLSGARLEALIDQSTGPSKLAYQRIQREDAKLRSRYLIGRVASTAVSAVCFLQMFLPAFSVEVAAWVSLAVTVVVTSLLFEISTSLARKHADDAAAIACRWLRPLEIATLPLALPLGWLGERLSRRDEGEPPADPKVTEAEVEALVDEGERAGLFDAEPANMIRNVLEFAGRSAKDVMIPRAQVDAIEVSTPIDRVLRRVSESGHSRYPVYKGEIDNIVGLLYAKDLFKAVQMDDEELASPISRTGIDDLIRTTANFVAESQPLATLLREMKSRRQHLAIVVDEFGSVSGIVTLEDVLEEIVGEIEDEHDAAAIEDLGDGHVMADAAISMKELFAHFGTGDSAIEEDESIGVMLTHHLGKIPEVGTAFSKFGLRFIVRASDDKHVGKVEVIRA